MLYQLWLVGQISYDNKVPFPRISGEGGAVCLQTALSPEYSVIFGLAAVVSLGSVKGIAEPQAIPTCLKSEPVRQIECLRPPESIC